MGFILSHLVTDGKRWFTSSARGIDRSLDRPTLQIHRKFILLLPRDLRMIAGNEVNHKTGERPWA
jgi:hypothetical protein